MQPIEFEAKTVEEAIALACQELKTTQDNLGIEVLEETPGKIRSLFSGRKAKIRAALKINTYAKNQHNDEDTAQLKQVFERIIKCIDPGARMEIRSEQDEIIFNIIGNGSGIFIGKKGQTLEALQYLLNKIRLRLNPDTPHIVVDSEGYHLRHIQNLISLAQRLSEKAKKKGGPVTTNPLNAADRRVIHMTLKKDSELTTWSKGDGGMRKVIIAPRQ